MSKETTFMHAHPSEKSPTVSTAARAFRYIAASALVAVFLAACTQGTTGIFADIEQEVKVRTNNLVDNTFVAGVARADTDGSGDRYYAVAGTKLFSREVDGSDWSGAGAPSSRPVVQYVASINGTELYAVFRESEKDNYGLYKLDDGSWNLVFDPGDQDAGQPEVDRITGLVGIDANENGTLDTLIATMADSDGKRYLVVDPQGNGSAVFHEFDGSNGDDIGANRPAGKALVADGKLWVARNGLWVIDVGDLDTAGTLERVATPANLGSFTYVPGEDRLFLVTLNGGVYRSPVLAGTTAAGVSTAWDLDDWDSVGSSNRALSDILWVPQADRFLVSTITFDGSVRRGYFDVTPGGDDNDDFSSLSFSDPGGNYRSTELITAGISGMLRLPGDDTVFALTEQSGLWATESYVADPNNPTWRWE